MGFLYGKISGIVGVMCFFDKVDKILFVFFLEWVIIGKIGMCNCLVRFWMFRWILWLVVILIIFSFIIIGVLNLSSWMVKFRFCLICEELIIFNI